MKIIYPNGSGGIAVIHPTGEISIEAVALKDVPQGVPYRFVEDGDIPTDRTFRNAWKPDLTVDMPKARSIHRDRLRVMRKPLLDALDVEYQRADEAGDATGKKAVAARKQALRNVTADPAIDAAKTPEELLAVMPDALKQGG